jgi:hypothetical protein
MAAHACLTVLRARALDTGKAETARSAKPCRFELCPNRSQTWSGSPLSTFADTTDLVASFTSTDMSLDQRG